MDNGLNLIPMVNIIRMKGYIHLANLQRRNVNRIQKELVKYFNMPTMRATYKSRNVLIEAIKE